MDDLSCDDRSWWYSARVLGSGRMISITITRLRSDERATESVVTVVGTNSRPWSCAALELPWRDNQRAASRIPEGDYPLVAHISSRFRNVAEGILDNAGQRYAGMPHVADVPGRSWILFHWGNYARDTDGCVLPGRTFSWRGREPMVTSSRPTFADFYKRIRPALDGTTPGRVIVKDADQ